MVVRPTGKGIILVVVLSVLHPLATLALVLRLYARRLIRGIGVDDYLMVLGWVRSPSPRNNACTLLKTPV
jgi:hypothetical protein